MKEKIPLHRTTTNYTSVHQKCGLGGRLATHFHSKSERKFASINVSVNWIGS